MKKSLLYKATVIAMLFCVTYNISDAHSPSDWLSKWLDKDPYEIDRIKFHNEDYQFDIHPSADCDTIKAIFFSNFWESGAVEMSPGYRTVNILIDNASQELYIPFKTVTYSYPTSIESFKKSHPTKYIDSWIRAKWEGDKLVFKDRSRIGVNNYDLEFEEDYFSMSDTIRTYGAKPQTRCEFHVWRGSLMIPDGSGYIEEKDYGLCYKMAYTHQDVTLDFNRTPLLVRNPNSALYIGPYDSSKYINGGFYIPKNEAFFNDILIGVLSPHDPDYLPAPEAKVKVEWKDSKTHYDNYDHPGYTYLTAKVKLDLVTDDGYIIDPAKIKANILADGTCIQTCGVNPFFNDDAWPNRTITYRWERERWEKFPKIEVRCVYEMEDGATIASPLVEADVKIISRPSGSGIDENKADKVFIDHSTYDLTGRKVDPENLAPGIYIRDGRKFTVGRH